LDDSDRGACGTTSLDRSFAGALRKPIGLLLDEFFFLLANQSIDVKSKCARGLSCFMRIDDGGTIHEETKTKAKVAS
jgi:hypothetical protein